MKKPRLFFITVLVLLIINTAFFIAWYGFDLQGSVKRMIERELSNTLEGNFSIGEFSIGDRQIIASRLRFKHRKDEYNFEVEQLRIRYNLLLLLLTKFDLGRGILSVEIEKPIAQIKYEPTDEPRSSSTPFEIPDLTKYFKQLRVSNGSALLHLGINTSSDSIQVLVVSERISDLSLTLDNDTSSHVNLSMRIGKKGTIKAKGELNMGAIHKAELELEAYSPSQIVHDLVKDFHCEISGQAKLHQEHNKAPLQLSYNTILWNTSGNVYGQTLLVPYLSARGSLKELSMDISESSIGASRLAGSIYIGDLDQKASLSAQVKIPALDTSIFFDSLRGLVRGTADIQGSLKKPIVSLKLAADELHYLDYKVSDLSVKADYQEQVIVFDIQNLEYEQHKIQSIGSYDIDTQQLKGSMNLSPVLSAAPVSIRSDVKFDVTFIGSYPIADIELQSLDAVYAKYHSGLSRGKVKLAPLFIDGSLKHYLADIDIQSQNGLSVNAIGDVISRSATAKVQFDKLLLNKVVNDSSISHYKPYLDGELVLILNGNNISGGIETILKTDAEIRFAGSVISKFSYDIDQKSGTLLFESANSSFNDQEFDISFFANLLDSTLSVSNLNLNDRINLSGKIDLAHPETFCADMVIKNISTDYLQGYIDFTGIVLPSVEHINMEIKYNLCDTREIYGKLELSGINIDPLKTLNSTLLLEGTERNFGITGAISDGYNTMLKIDGKANLVPQINVDVTATTDKLAIRNLIKELPIFAHLDSKLQISYKDILGEQEDLTISAILSSENAVFREYVIDSVRVDIVQRPNVLKVNEVRLYAKNLAELNANGALDYNLLSGTFFEGDSELYLNMSVELMRWLTNNIPYFENAKGSTSLECTIGTQEDQFSVISGNLMISNGFFKLKDQMESISDFRLHGTFENNRFTLSDARFDVGQGKVFIRNYFDPEPSDHFMVGPLDLGIWQVRTNSNGILVNVPYYSPPRTLTKVILQGRNSDFITVKGPFDDMKILGDAYVSNTSAVYPSNTDNLMKLINTVRESATSSSNDGDESAPLPFVLDAMIIVQDNARYVTYPLNIEVNPNSFLHLIYDGQDFSVRDASFISERGTIDFLGTLFNVDFVNVSIVEAQNITNIDGTFYKRAADGTMVTLRVSTSRDSEKPFLSRLEFTLSSDNPQDRTITHIISRLRYNESIEDLNPDQRNSLLQDEALNMISQNLNTSILTPFLHPLENRIRRTLRLDSFTIRAGFIQNLFNEYTTDSSQLAQYTDLKQIDSDLMEFSSSILLNNLSVSMSKYLGRKMFIDYQFELQEATDLSKKTKILISHDTSLRMMLPLRFRIAYTLKYEPLDESLSHEVRLQRSFRF